MLSTVHTQICDWYLASYLLNSIAPPYSFETLVLLGGGRWFRKFFWASYPGRSLFLEKTVFLAVFSALSVLTFVKNC